MVSSLEERYLSSAGLSLLRTHFFATIKMSGETITYSGYCHPLFPRQFHHNSSPKSRLCAYPLQKGSKFFKSSIWKYSIQELHGVIFFLKKKWEKEVPMILSKSSSKEECNKMTRKCFQKCEFISSSPLDICNSTRSEFDQVPTSCEPLFGSAT